MRSSTPPVPRQTRRPPSAIRHWPGLLGELGKIGGNINQIAPPPERRRPLYRVQNNIDASLRDLSELRMACPASARARARVGRRFRRLEEGDGAYVSSNAVP
jgi:hypothetical protein